MAEELTTNSNTNSSLSSPSYSGDDNNEDNLPRWLVAPIRGDRKAGFSFSEDDIVEYELARLDGLLSIGDIDKYFKTMSAPIKSSSFSDPIQKQ